MYDLVSFVLRGHLRKKILRELKNPKTPTQIAELLDTQRSSISRSILDLEKKGLVVCLTPDEKMGRLYQITDLGQSVLNNIEDYDNE